MSKEAMEGLIKRLSTVAEKSFNEFGALPPVFCCVTGDGQPFMLPAIGDDKEQSFAIARAVIQRTGVVLYVFISEAWVGTFGPDISKAELREIDRRGLKDHPDRREVVVYNAEDREGNAVSAQQLILRPEVSKPVLSPLQFVEVAPGKSRGRGANMFGERTSIITGEKA